MTANVTVYSTGLCYSSVCAEAAADRDEVERAVNLQLLGNVTPWRIADEPFAAGEANPHPCEQDASRAHWLLVC